MTRNGTRLSLLALGIGLLAALPPLASAQNGTNPCGITGPATVNVGESFTLCAPSGNRGYDWNGPGIRGADDERCLRVRGLEEGTYTYRLRLRVSRWETRDCRFTVSVVRAGGGLGQACLITGPTRVAPNTTFMLCGPDSTGFGWSWSGGSGLPSNDSTRCVTISGGLAAGRYVFSLDLSRNGSTVTCRHAVVVEDDADDVCFVSGPASIGVDEPFRLCGPEGSGFTYGWSGDGAPSDSNQRCLSFPGGLPRGSHEFTLRLGGAPGGTRLCRFTVMVRERDGDGGFGVGCPRPLSFWRDLCDRERGRRGGDDDDDARSPAVNTEHHGNGSWSGAISREDLAAILACLDDHSDVFDWTNGERRLCNLLESRDWRDRGPRRELRQQYAVLLLNHCAGELGILDRDGNALGSGVDPFDGISCRGVQADDLDDLFAQLEDLLGGNRTRLALEHGWGRRERERRLERWTECLADLNRGDRECRNRGGRDKDDDDDDLVSGSLDAARPSGIVLERPVPNPFAASTRLHFAVERDATPVSIGIYDVSGRLVRRLVNETRDAGVHEISWNGIDAAGSRVHPGVYFVRGSIGARPMSIRVLYLQ